MMDAIDTGWNRKITTQLTADSEIGHLSVEDKHEKIIIGSFLYKKDVAQLIRNLYSVWEVLLDTPTSPYP